MSDKKSDSSSTSNDKQKDGKAELREPAGWEIDLWSKLAREKHSQMERSRAQRHQCGTMLCTAFMLAGHYGTVEEVRKDNPSLATIFRARFYVAMRNAVDSLHTADDDMTAATSGQPCEHNAQLNRALDEIEHCMDFGFTHGEIGDSEKSLSYRRVHLPRLMATVAQLISECPICLFVIRCALTDCYEERQKSD